MALKLREIVSSLGGNYAGPLSLLDLPYEGVSIDSRKECKGRVFVALKGERFDGHHFVTVAWRKGSSLVVVEREVEVPHIRVNDTLSALKELGVYILGRVSPRVVGVTGSSGKTTTKEMIASILSGEYRVHKTIGNYNNLIGLPFTLANMDLGTEVVVLEMGTNSPGEIRELGKLACPDIGIITNIGHAHLGPLGGVEGVKKAKAELLDAIRSQGILIHNADDPLSRELAHSFHRRLSFGVESGDVRAKVLPIVEFEGGWITPLELLTPEGLVHVRLPFIGGHHVYNALAATSVGLVMNVSLELIRKGLEATAPVWGRMRVKRLGEAVVLDDVYNANPDSMRWALKTVAMLPGVRKLALLGSMLELGEYSYKYHRWIGKEAVKLGFDWVGVLGEDARWIKEAIAEEGLPCSIFRDHEEAASYLKGLLGRGDILLVKGSRGMRMEKVLEFLGVC